MAAKEKELDPTKDYNYISTIVLISYLIRILHSIAILLCISYFAG